MVLIICPPLICAGIDLTSPVIALIKAHAEEAPGAGSRAGQRLVPMADARGSGGSHHLFGLKPAMHEPQAGDGFT